MKELQPQTSKQLPLFTIPDNGSSSFKDPAFTQNKNVPVHRWVPWIAGFSADFVRDTLSNYLHSPATVLDPFCGVGTALVEALLLGHKTIGFEINPYAVFACRVKLYSHRVDIKGLETAIVRFQEFYKERVSSNYLPKSAPPRGFRTRSAFYSPRVLRKVLIFFDYVETIGNKHIQDLFRLAFASTMIRYSNYSYEPSLGRRASAGKPEIQDFPVGQTISLKLREILEDIIWLKEHLPNPEVDARIIPASFLGYKNHLEPNSVDLIITSPPYLNNYHYNRNTRPQLYWLGFVKSPSDLKALEQANFGKYWQTVRGLEHIELRFSLPDTDLEERLEVLRQTNPDKGIYGGRGWANYATSYFNDCYIFAQGIYHVLKPGGRAFVVLGNSILQGVLIPTDRYFAAIATAAGLEVVRIEVPRATRVGNSIIRSEVRAVKAKKPHQLYEAVIELRKR